MAGEYPRLTHVTIASKDVWPGQRGITAYWRTGVVVHNSNALRYLEVK